MTDLSRCIIIVEGNTEVTALNDKFQKEYGIKPAIRKVSCNGKNVSAEIFCEKAFAVVLAALSTSAEHILIILDKEKGSGRDSSFNNKIKETIIKKIAIKTKYKKRDLESKISVYVPDIMFENWILGDVLTLKHRYFDEINESATQKSYDGKHGATELDKIMKIKYKKTIHGPKYFKAIDLSICSINSPSFNSLYVKLIK